MDVKDFVKNTLIQIVQGVEEASAEIENIGRAVINPALSHSNYANPQEITFDLAVTVQEQSTVEGRIGAGIAVIKSNVNAESNSANSSTNRISFKVPVSLPSKAAEQYVKSEKKDFKLNKN